MKKKSIFGFGKVIPGLKIHGEDATYPVLNERAIRAGAGIMLAIGLFAFINALLLNNFVYLKVVVTLFMIDFGIRIFLNPKFSPVSIIANWIVQKQKPDYVGAIQKRFAWSIGFVLATTMFLLLNVFAVRGAVNLTICTICLSVMYLETSFGICVGCKVYQKLQDIGWIKKPEVKPACPGGSCSLKK